jgi:hypothetical protein
MAQFNFRRSALAAALSLLLATPALAVQNSDSGYDALALAQMIGAQDQSLPEASRRALAGVALGAWTHERAEAAHLQPVHISAQSVRCHISDIAINSYRCVVRFDEQGARTTEISGRDARELLNLLRVIGAPPDAGAGQVYFEISQISCDVDVAVAADAAGGGAQCSYAHSDD